MPVRLFVGNLPFGATEADLRNHFSALAPPVSILMPVNRETGRPRGFAFVDFADRSVAEEAIRRFHGQSFQGRPLAVSEARAREDRPPGGFAPRPDSDRHGPPRFIDPTGAPPRDRDFGRGEPKRTKAAPSRKHTKAETGGPKGPIRERHTGRVFDVDEYGAKEEPIDVGDFEDFSTRAKDPFAPPDKPDKDEES